MNIAIQYAVNLLLASIEASLLGYAFFLAFVGCRHIAFAVAGAFLAGPYIWWLTAPYVGEGVIGVAAAILMAAILGLLYWRFSSWLISRGSGADHLLLVSLAVFATCESGLALGFGSEGIWTSESAAPRVLGEVWGVRISTGHLLLFVVGGGLLVAFPVLWRSSNLGRVMRGLLESREGMMLRGFRVQAIEAYLSVFSFCVAAGAGLLHVGGGLVLKPSSGLDAGLVGVVAFIAGVAISRGFGGIALAALLIATTRFGLQMLSAGDWNRTAPLVVLIVVIAVSRVKSLHSRESV